MTTLRTRASLVVARRAHRDVLVFGAGPDAVNILPDPDGTVAAAIRACAARDKLRKEKH